MNKFEIGDRVTSTYRPSRCPADRVATVREICSEESLVIQFDLNAGEDFGHGAGEYKRTGCWFVDPSHLTYAKRMPSATVESPVTPKITKKFSPKSQNGKLLVHLASGNSITQLQAFGVYGIYRLAARIHELTKAGHKIKTVMKTDATGRVYAEYSLHNKATKRVA